MCRSRRELSNEYCVFSCKIWLRSTAAAAAENEPCKGCPLSAYSSPRFDDTKARQGELDRAVLEHLRANVVEEVALKDEVKRITELAAKHLEDNLPMVPQSGRRLSALAS